MTGTKAILDKVKARQEFTKINFQFLSKYSFFGYIMAGSNKEINPNIRACAGMNIGKCLNLYFHPEKFFPLPAEEKDFVILHEIGHFVFKHPWRAGKFYEQGLTHEFLNFCMDLAINSWLKDTCNVPTPEWVVLPEYYDLPPSKSFDFYVNTLKRNYHGSKPTKKGGIPSPYSFPIGGDGGDHDWTVDVDPHEAEGLARSMFNTARKQAGDSRLGILVEAYAMKAWADWQDAFKTTCQSSEVSDETIFTKRKISRRFKIPPGIKHDYRGEIHIFVDCSGSMSQEEIAECFGVINQLNSLGYVIWIHEFDAGSTHPPYIYNKVPPHVHGGGGTVVRPVLRDAKERFPKITEAVILTDAGIGDLEGQRPEGYRRIHFAVTRQGHYGFDHLPDWGGKKVKIETHTN